MLKKTLLIGIVSILVILLLAMLLAPRIAKRYIINHSQELVGRQIDLGKIKINYFTATIRLIDFKMFEANEKEVFVSFDTLRINAEPLHLFKDELVVEEFYLKGLQARIIQNDSIFNFDDLVTFFEAAGDTTNHETEVDSTVSDFKFEFSNIAIREAIFTYQDIPLEKTLSTKNLNLEVPFISWDQQHSSEAGLKFYFENGGFFQSKIEVDPKSKNFNAQININRLELQPFYEYTLDYANLGSLEGSLNTNLVLTGNIDYPEEILVSGPFDLYNFKTTDQRQLPFISVPRIHGRLKKIDYAHEYYAFDTLALYDPHFYVEIYDSTINVYEATDYYAYFPPEEDDDEIEGSDNTLAGSVDSTTSVLYYGFDHLEINNGTMDLVDKTTPDPFQYNLSNIELNADSIFSNADWVTLYADMLLNKRGKLASEIGFFPEDPMDLSLNYVITDFLLSDLNIYSRHYMGFPILYGDMYYKSNTQILKGQLTSDNKLVITNAEIGDKRGGLYNLPLKFALFLLKDRDGVIDLDIPVRGDLNDPKVSIGKIVWQTFKNLIIKVAAAPFDFLASVISVDPKDIKSIEYAYLDTAFTEQRKRQVDLLLELEQKKQDLEIELVYFNDVDKEKRQIAVYEAGKMFSAETGKDYRSDEPDFIEFLKLKTETDSIDIGDAALEIIPASIVDSLSAQFRQFRRNSIENYLDRVGDSTEIKVFIPDPKSPKNLGSEPKFEVKYSIKGTSPDEE
ncbi:MAG: DUF748 domain-containing protein [Bacteroidetes bacterium]|nr:DUF748 domain-containing protein [Bacteroidota bacterium]